ncbi:MAG: leucine-rich repeat protein [Treponema sp.]|nr:leucine-rich repeat protein [Treponema sp.]
MNIKKSFLILSFVMVAALFVSCRNSVQGGKAPSGSNEYAYISINVQPVGRSAIVEKDSDLVKKINEIVLTGIREGDDEPIELLAPDPETTFDELSEDISGIKIQTGTWDFTFSAKLEDVAFSGTINSQKIVTGNNTLNFTLAPEINRGGFNIKLILQKSAQLSTLDEEVLEKVVATLENTDDLTVETITKVFDLSGKGGNEKILTSLDDPSISTSNYELIYNCPAWNNKENLAPGTYRLTFDVYTKGTVNPKGDLIPLNSVSFIINITAGFNSYINNSSKAESMILGSTYKITYNKNDDDSDIKAAFVEDIIPEFYSYKTPEITLPVLTRQGYEFLGWWFRGAKITKLDPSTNPGNVTLYAKWLRYTNASGEIITEDGLLDISVKMPEKLYRNAGTFTFEAKMKGSEDALSAEVAANVSWYAMLMYQGMPMDMIYASETYYEYDDVENTCSITKTLPVCGNYQIFVAASLNDEEFGSTYTGSTTSRTFDFEIPADDYLFEINNTCGTSYDDLKNEINTVFYQSKGKPLNIKLIGNTGNDQTGNPANDEFLHDIGNSMKTYNAGEIVLDCSELAGVTSLEADYVTGSLSVFANTKLTKIILPKSLKTLKAYSFNCGYTENDNHLEYIEIPDTIENMEDIAFGYINFIKEFKTYQAGETVNTNSACKVINNNTILTITTVENVNNDPVTTTSVIAIARGADLQLERLDFNEGEFANITKISPYVFSNLKNLNYVNLGNVTEIGMGGFASSGLSEGVVFNENKNIIIGRQAFYKCEIQNISLPKNLSFTPTEVKHDEEYPEDPHFDSYYYNEAFSYCESLKTVTIASDFTNDIDYSIFYRCPNIEKFIMSGSETGVYSASTIGNGAFLIKEYTPQGEQNPVKMLISAAQKGIPETVDFSTEDITEIGPLAFECNTDNEYSERSLFSVTSFGNITKIGKEAFKGSGITKIESFGAAKNFGNDAFMNTPLASIPPVTEGMIINSFAFASTRISELTISSPKITIGGSAFQPAMDDERRIINNEINNPITRVIIDFPIDSITEDLTDYSQYLPADYDRNGDTKPYSYDFYISRHILSYWCGLNSVKELEFNKSVKLRDYSDTEYDMSEYTYLPNVLRIIVNSKEVQYHTERPFANLIDENGNNTVESITFKDSNSITIIGSYQFHNFNKLKNITLSGGETKINKNAFNDSNEFSNASMSLNPVDLTGVTVIGENAFFGCLSGVDVVIPESVIAIGYNAFGSGDYGIPASITVEGNGTWVTSEVNETIWSNWITNGYDSSGIPVTLTDQLNTIGAYLLGSPSDYFYRVQ